MLLNNNFSDCVHDAIYPAETQVDARVLSVCAGCEDVHYSEKVREIPLPPEIIAAIPNVYWDHYYVGLCDVCDDMVSQMSQINGNNGEATNTDDLAQKWSPVNVQAVTKVPSGDFNLVGDPVHDPTVFGFVCYRSQVATSVQFASGLYYADVYGVYRCNEYNPAAGAEPQPLTQTLCMKLQDVSNYTCYFIVGSLVGGKKNGKRAVPMPIRKLAAQVKGAFNKATKNIPNPKQVGRKINRALKSAGESAALVEGLAALGMGSYRSRGAYLAAPHGRGSYHDNSLINPMGPPIQMAHKEDETGAITINFREYIRDVYSDGSAFSNTAISVNPGLDDLFPFLSQIASNYTEYEFQQLIFEYVPTVANVTAQGQLGTTIFALNYNAGEQPFTSKTQMMGYSGAINAIISDGIRMGVECDRSKTIGGHRFVRSGHIPDGQDVKTYDLGLLQIATSGVNETAFPVGTQIGELHVYYTVTLYKPKISQSVGLNIDYDTFVQYATSTQAPSSFFLRTDVFSMGENNTLGGTFVNTASECYYQFPDNFSGYIRLISTMTGTALANIWDWTIAGTNISQYKTFLQSDGSYLAKYAVGSGLTNVCMYTYWVQPAKTAGGNRITYSQGSFSCTNRTSMQLTIEQISPLEPVSSKDVVNV